MTYIYAPSPIYGRIRSVMEDNFQIGESGSCEGCLLIDGDHMHQCVVSKLLALLDRLEKDATHGRN